MKTAFTALFVALSSPALANGFFLGGMADGMREAQEIDLQRRALENDRRTGGSSYERLRMQIEMDRLRRAIEENNRLLKEQAR